MTAHVRDGPVRRVLKAVARGLAWVDLSSTRAVLRRRGEQRYRLVGSCNGCGKCCEQPSMPVSRVTWFVPTVRAVFLWWQRVVNGFEFRAADPRFRVFTFHCTHFDPTTKQCDSYESRPLMCRDYPVNLTFAAVPRLFPECSYEVRDAKADALRAALRSAGLEGEKLAEVEKKLFLGDDDQR